MLKDLRRRLRIYSIRKLYNLIMGKVQFSIGSTRLYYFPAKITIESGNICNLRCPLCPSGQKDSSARKGLLSFSDFKRIIDEIGKNLLLIRLYNWGEPLLNKELTKMAEYADSFLRTHSIGEVVTQHAVLLAEEAKIRTAGRLMRDAADFRRIFRITEGGAKTRGADSLVHNNG